MFNIVCRLFTTHVHVKIRKNKVLTIGFGMPKALIIGSPSDAHTWNLFYLKLFIEECSISTHVLGGCTHLDDISATVASQPWDLIVISSLNGHFFHESKAIMDIIQATLDNCAQPKPWIIAGGKLDTQNRSHDLMERVLLKQGYDKLFFRPDAMNHFRTFCKTLVDQKKADHKENNICSQSYAQSCSQGSPQNFKFDKKENLIPKTILPKRLKSTQKQVLC